MHDLNPWLNYLETLHPKTIDLGLERVGQVARRLDLTNFSCLVITVAGTNGKGSCVTLLEAILQAQGYKTGVYTSPHLLKYNERVRINTHHLTDFDLCSAFQAIEDARENISLTYFEFGTLAALWLFRKANLDAVILEVGMGGRLDAVNIVEPDISVITTIALDHCEWLGNDREAIGFEKAGIMRANKPTVCGDFDVPKSVRTKAKELSVDLYCQGKDFFYNSFDPFLQAGQGTKKENLLMKKKQSNWQWKSRIQQFDQLPLPKIALQNASTVLQVVELLNQLNGHKNPLKITEQAIRKGLQNVFITGRFQIIKGNVTTIVDVAHNPAGSELLSQQLQALPCVGSTLAVVAILQDKDLLGTIKPLLPIVSTWYVAGLNVSRGGSSEALAKHLRAQHAEKINEYVTVLAAYKAALTEANTLDRIIVFGSFYTVAEILKANLTP